MLTNSLYVRWNFSITNTSYSSSSSLTDSSRGFTWKVTVVPDTRNFVTRKSLFLVWYPTLSTDSRSSGCLFLLLVVPMSLRMFTAFSKVFLFPFFSLLLVSPPDDRFSSSVSFSFSFFFFLSFWRDFLLFCYFEAFLVFSLLSFSSYFVGFDFSSSFLPFYLETFFF